jgi:hypothetical protein
MANREADCKSPRIYLFWVFKSFPSLPFVRNLHDKVLTKSYKETVLVLKAKEIQDLGR